MYDNVLIDGKNIVYRAVAVSINGGSHPISIILRMFGRYRNEFYPKYWNVFWDPPKDTLWRKKIYSPYKGGRPSFDQSFVDLVKLTQRICVLLFNNMKITQYIRVSNEADDLMYAFILCHRNDHNLIISSDKDIHQIIYKFKNVDVHDPGKKEQLTVPIPTYDPVIMKCLTGDKSDNIVNYRLVKEITARKIIDKGLDEFFVTHDRKLFDINRKLIDLKMNPELKDNIRYVFSVKRNDNFDYDRIIDLIHKYNMQELISEIPTKVMVFKNN